MHKLERRLSAATELGTTAPPWRTQPRGLPALVSIEMWERFSFYGMQAILVFYLYADDGLGLSKQDATAIIGAYGAFVYLCCILGGFLADRVWGPERVLLSGATTVMVGHATLSFTNTATGLTFGLVMIGLGSGFIKTCAITILGQLYPADSHNATARKDFGFQLFYLSIQIGSLLGPLLTGYLADRYSWQLGFLAAAILMAIGVFSYAMLRPRMLAELNPAQRDLMLNPRAPLRRSQVTALISSAIVCSVLLGAIALRTSLTISALANGLLAVVLFSIVGLFGYLWRSPLTTAAERRQLTRFLPLFLSACIFWSVAYQNFGVFAVYADLKLNRNVGSFEIPAAWIQTLNPILVMALAIPVSLLRSALHRQASHTASTMAWGVIASAVAFLLFVPVSDGGPHSTPLVVMCAIAAIIALGELCIGPVGMAATATCAPSAHRTLFSALYFLNFAVGMAASGALSRFYDPENAAAERTYFLVTGLVTLTLGALLLLWQRYLRNKASSD
ncbi:peptide MFS transporter [Corynebacterium epidermidicanis]|nr:oligopeptide:H+ symporter [Corynebacterium epidermidicanis]